MHCLFLDLGSHNGSIACIDDATVKLWREVDHRIDDRQFVELLENTIKEAGWAYADLTHIACVIGPGGFTSLRVAVAATNTLASDLSIPCAGIHLSDLYRARATVKDIWWVHSTKKTETFVRGFGSYTKAMPEAECVSLDALVELLQSGDQWMGELIANQREKVDALGATEASLQPLQDILPDFLSSQSFQNQILLPWYGRGW